MLSSTDEPTPMPDTSRDVIFRCRGCGCALEADEPQPWFCIQCWMEPRWSSGEMGTQWSAKPPLSRFDPGLDLQAP